MSDATFNGAWEVFKSVKIAYPLPNIYDPIEGEKRCPICKKGIVKYHIENPQGIFAGHFSVYCSTKNCISFIK